MKPFNYAKHRITECGLDFSIRGAARLFLEENSGSLLVQNEEGKYVGMFTDLTLFKLVSEGLDLSEKKLSDIELEKIVFVEKNAGFEEVMEKFNESDSGRLVLHDSNYRVVGVLKRKNIERLSAFRIAKNLLRK